MDDGSNYEVQWDSTNSDIPRKVECPVISMKRVSRFSAYQSELKKLKQTDNELGCIPTNIAAALRAYGVPHASEKLIQLAYQYAISFEKVKC